MLSNRKETLEMPVRAAHGDIRKSSSCNLLQMPDQLQLLSPRLYTIVPGISKNQDSRYGELPKIYPNIFIDNDEDDPTKVYAPTKSPVFSRHVNDPCKKDTLNETSDVPEIFAKDFSACAERLSIISFLANQSFGEQAGQKTYNSWQLQKNRRYKHKSLDL